MAWEEISSVYEQLNQCAFQIENIARAKERQRIARDLHDSLGQALTALNVQLQTALKLWKLDPTEAESFLIEAQRLSAIAIKEVRQCVCSLRAKAIADQPLEQLIKSLVKDFQQVTGVSISTCINLCCNDLPPEVSTTLYRVIQEALTNICKHAAATAVEIKLQTLLDSVQLVITDNGKGFKQNSLPKGFGLQGMAERVEALRGQFDIKTQPGKGCRLTVELPLLQEEATTTLLSEPNPSYVKSTGKNLPDLNHQTIDENFLRLCEKHLIDLVGPFAPLLIKETLKSSLGISRQELVETIAAKIPDAQVACEFRQSLKSLLDTQTQTVTRYQPKKVEQPFQHQSLNDIAADVFAFNAEPAESLVMRYEQSLQLEKMLTNSLGSFASSLVQQVTQQVLNCKELIAELLCQNPVSQSTELEEQVTLLFESPASQVKSTGEYVTKLNHQTQIIDDSFIYQCEQQLMNLVGPFTPLLMKETLKSSLGVSRREFVEAIAAKIPDVSVAVEFQQRMYSCFHNSSPRDWRYIR
jgi:two-component sensor histidine kinase